MVREKSEILKKLPKLHSVLLMNYKTSGMVALWWPSVGRHPAMRRAKNWELFHKSMGWEGGGGGWLVDFLLVWLVTFGRVKERSTYIILSPKET